MVQYSHRSRGNEYRYSVAVKGVYLYSPYCLPPAVTPPLSLPHPQCVECGNTSPMQWSVAMTRPLHLVTTHYTNTCTCTCTHLLIHTSWMCGHAKHTHTLSISHPPQGFICTCTVLGETPLTQHKALPHPSIPSPSTFPLVKFTFNCYSWEGRASAISFTRSDKPEGKYVYVTSARSDSLKSR